MILIINSEMIHCYNESLELIICMLIYVNYDQVYKIINHQYMKH